MTDLPADAHEWGLDDWRAWSASLDQLRGWDSPVYKPSPDQILVHFDGQWHRKPALRHGGDHD